MARTQKNKATNYHLGTLKAKLAKLRSELINGPGGKSAGSKDAGRGFDVTKSGDTRVGLVGFPSVGKSTLLTTSYCTMPGFASPRDTDFPSWIFPGPGSRTNPGRNPGRIIRPDSKMS